MTFLCLLCIGGFAAYGQFTNGSSWKQYSFENGTFLVHLPFALKNTTPRSVGRRIGYAQNYQAGNDRLNIILSYTELKDAYEFVLEEMFDHSLEALKGRTDIKLLGHKYEELKYGSYSAGKMTVDYVSGSTKFTSQYLYILVEGDRSWCLINTYPSENGKSKEASERVFASVKLE
jgi:hypothetical protein